MSSHSQRSAEIPLEMNFVGGGSEKGLENRSDGGGANPAIDRPCTRRSALRDRLAWMQCVSCTPSSISRDDGARLVTRQTSPRRRPFRFRNTPKSVNAATAAAYDSPSVNALYAAFGLRGRYGRALTSAARSSRRKRSGSERVLLRNWPLEKQRFGELALGSPAHCDTREAAGSGGVPSTSPRLCPLLAHMVLASNVACPLIRIRTAER